MTAHIIRRITGAGVLAALILCSDCLAAGRILVVHSYHEKYSWVQGIDESIRTEIGRQNVDLKAFYMDTKRKPSESWKQQAAEKANDLVRSFKPDVVIAVDDNAQSYFVKDYVGTSDIQFVFCGVNADPEMYGYPASNVTGILERTYPAQTLKLLKILMPNIESVAVVSDESTTGSAIRERLLHRIATQAPEFSLIRYAEPKTLSAWKQEIIRLDQDRMVDVLLIPLYFTVRREGTATSVDSKQVLSWTLAHTRKPVVGLWPNFIEDGGLLAVTVDPQEHGRVAARMALEILGGKSAADISMRTNTDGYVMVNLRDNRHFIFNANVQVDQIADMVIR